MKETKFLKVLQDVAKDQKALGQRRLVPEGFSSLANFVASYTWQTILVLSLVSTVFLKLL